MCIDLFSISLPTGYWESNLKDDSRLNLVKVLYRNQNRYRHEPQIKKTVKTLNGINVIYFHPYYDFEKKTSVSGKLYLKGSIHKYYNLIKTGISQNYSQFTYKELVEAIGHLCVSFGFLPLEAKLHSLEFAVNLIIDKSPTQLIQENLIMYKAKAPQINDKLDFEQDGYLARFKKCNYQLKFYDKGKQNKLKNNIFRIEHKALRYSQFSKSGISNLSDLTDKLKLQELGKIYDKIMSHTIFIDDLSFKSVGSLKDRRYLIKHVNPQYLNTLKGRHKTKVYANFKKLLAKYGLNQLKDGLLSSAHDVWMNLLDDIKLQVFVPESNNIRSLENGTFSTILLEEKLPNL